MRKALFWLGMMLAVALASLACAPSAVPAPLPPAPAPAAPAPALTPEEAAWQKVVAAAKKEGRLTIYSFHFVADVGRKIAEDFQRQYGIPVEILAAASRVSVERIMVERQIKQPIADMLQSSPSSAAELVVRGLGSSVWKELPVLKDNSAFIMEPVEGHSPGGENIAFSPQIDAAPINTNVVKPQDEPRSIFDLLQPRWKGKMLSPDPRAGGGSSTFFYSLRYFKITDMDYYRRLAQQDLRFWGGSNMEAYRMVGRGEYPIYLVGTTVSVAPLIAEGAPVKLLAWDEGNFAMAIYITMVKDAPHPNAAKLFINWLLSPEGQLSFGKSSSVLSIRKDVPDFTTPGARITPKKLITLTWDAREQMSKEVRDRVFDDIFGKK